ncbi:hypothetical protein GOL22_14095 [Sinorhizobium medicae]|nr:hypothetical protein [Sinorhizobium medicae]
MATVPEHAASIVTLAGQADALVEQFRTLMASLEAEEAALYREAASNGPYVADGIAGRRRLGNYANERARYHAGAPLPPSHSKTVTELATAAWSEFLEA